MPGLVLVLVVLLTSLAALVVGRGRLLHWPTALRAAVGVALDCLGWTALFLAANVLLGAAVIVGFRALTGRFVSVYELADINLVFLSVLQGLLAHGARHPAS